MGSNRSPSSERDEQRRRRRRRSRRRTRRSRSRHSRSRSPRGEEAEPQSDEGSDSQRGGKEDSPSLCVTGIPQDRGEGDIFLLFERHAEPAHVRMVRDRATGVSTGLAFVDFKSAREAENALHSLNGSEMDGCRLGLEGVPDDKRTLSAPQHSYDWVCDDASCGCVNFSRRHECHECGKKRPLKPQLVEGSPSSGAMRIGNPSSGLMISGLEQHTDEDALRLAIAPIAPVKDIRLVREKHSLESRGFAFCDLFNVADAVVVLQRLNGQTISNQTTPLRISYAKERESKGSDHEQPHQQQQNRIENAEHALDAWEPMAFSETHMQGAPDPEPAPASRTTPDHDDDAHRRGQVAARGGAQGHEGAFWCQGGFVYDEASGYYYDAASGYYYEPWHGLYYHAPSGAWYKYDEQSNAFLVHSNGRWTWVAGGDSHPHHYQAGTSSDHQKAVNRRMHNALQPTSSVMDCCLRNRRLKRAPPLSGPARLNGTQPRESDSFGKEKADYSSRSKRKDQTRNQISVPQTTSYGQGRASQAVDGPKLYDEKPVTEAAAEGKVYGGRVRRKRQHAAQ